MDKVVETSNFHKEVMKERSAKVLDQNCGKKKGKANLPTPRRLCAILPSPFDMLDQGFDASG